MYVLFGLPEIFNTNFTKELNKYKKIGIIPIHYEIIWYSVFLMTVTVAMSLAIRCYLSVTKGSEKNL